MSNIRTHVSPVETTSVAGGPDRRTLLDMFSTMLTKRRAVDNCRTRSALCRMS